MSKYWLFGIVLVLIASMVYAVPNVTILNQTPSTITTTNIITTPLTVWANITSSTGLNLSTILIYLKNNNSANDISFYVNGTGYVGWAEERNYTLNVSSYFEFLAYENAVYSGIYNFAWLSFRYGTHTAVSLVNANHYVKVQFYNVSNAKYENYLAYMVNNTAGTDFSKVYYCNNSYTTGDPTTSNWCIFIYTASTNNWDHCHPGNLSCHMVAPIPILSGKVGTIDVTSTSYFIIGGSASGSQFWYISNNSRTGAIATTTNKGGTWVNQGYTVDANLKQYDGTDMLSYMICANNTGGNQTCSAVVSQTMTGAGPLPALPTVTNESAYTTGVCPITDSLQSTIFFIAIGIFIFAIFIISEVMPQLPPVMSFLPGMGMIFYSLPLFGCHVAYGLTMLIFAIIILINAWQKAWREAL